MEKDAIFNFVQRISSNAHQATATRCLRAFARYSNPEYRVYKKLSFSSSNSRSSGTYSSPSAPCAMVQLGSPGWEAPAACPSLFNNILWNF